MVSFGLAPAIVTYQWGVARLAEYGKAWGGLGWLAAFLYCAAAAFRLARFNANTGQDRRFFQGLPSPSAAAIVASMVWLATHYEIEGLVGLVAGITITAIAGLLMMSRFAYWSFKDINPGERVRFARLLLIPLVIIVIAVAPQVTIFLVVRRLRRIGSQRVALAPAACETRRLARGRRMSVRAERYLAEIGIAVYKRRGFDAQLADARRTPRLRPSPPSWPNAQPAVPSAEAWERLAAEVRACTLCGSAQDAHADGVRRRPSRRRAARDRRGAGRRRGPPGRAIRR